ncbi:hypothetical protein NUU61_001501 [Penicillium alfredii]|uniref:Myb-like domain-containing protein n=1 Tax=Penicillium alfredii TaxID=1506179 RepID=A0A9W9KNB6_9EURO|nr:uncharacterized protein NUU61_001501 [Penicillium alfredii]KAJ5111871.1 hypothetical protein NUU61_001501 [Penicillium alfredii]
MISIDLDNIIHYHPPPIPRPPCKPPHLPTSSRGSSHPPSNPPILIHPLPPRPPRHSHESPQTPHPRRQTTSSVVSCLPSDHDAHARTKLAHLNDFDKELADFDLAGIESQETSELRIGGGEESQVEAMNSVQRTELDDPYDDSHSNERHRDDLRLLSQDLTAPQDTATSLGAAETDLSSTSISPNEQSPIQNPSSVEHRENQLSLVDCETVANSVAADEPCHTFTSQRDCDIPRDQSPYHNPSTPVPARDETEPANQRLFGYSSEAGTEPGKSRPTPVTEAHSIQSQATDPTASHNGYLEAPSDGNEVGSTVCQLDEALSRPISPVLQQQKRAGLRPGGEDSPRDLPRSCSVSVVIPEPQFNGLGIKRSTRAGRARCTGKRRIRDKSPCDIDSDDPDDIDYTNGNDSGVGDIAALPRPAKSQRRAAAIKIQPRFRHQSPHPEFSSLARPQELFANPCPVTSLQDIETIPVRVFLTRQTFLSKVVYSCTFEEDRQPCSHGTSKAPSYSENMGQNGHTEQLSNRRSSARTTRFLPVEDELLVELKERRCLPWNRIVKHFPERTKNSLQVRYSTRLKDRGTESLKRDRSGRIKPAATAAAAHQEACGQHSISRTASSRSVDADLPTRQRYGPSRARRAVDRFSPA